MLFFSLMPLKVTLLPYYIQLVCTFPLFISDFSTFSVHRNFKASPSARCVSAVNVVCWNIDMFNKDRILLTHIS
jgi:hypothetical protein